MLITTTPGIEGRTVTEYLVPCQATFALLTIPPRRRSWALRFRQAI
jgi:hypothetical protein